LFIVDNDSLERREQETIIVQQAIVRIRAANRTALRRWDGTDFITGSAASLQAKK
jgi:hypothetical protein